MAAAVALLVCVALDSLGWAAAAGSASPRSYRAGAVQHSPIFPRGPRSLPDEVLAARGGGGAGQSAQQRRGEMWAGKRTRETPGECACERAARSEHARALR